MFCGASFFNISALQTKMLRWASLLPLAALATAQPTSKMSLLWIYTKNASCSGLAGHMKYLTSHRAKFNVASTTTYWISSADGVTPLAYPVNCSTSGWTSNEEFNARIAEEGFRVLPHVESHAGWLI